QYPDNSGELSGSLFQRERDRHEGKPLHYKGSTFHLMIPGYMVHGGDFTHGNGTGGESICCPSFTDENFVKKYISPGILSIAKTGLGGNGSQFCMCTAKT
ncbi:hypothetical protein Dsin_016863, partial [Dipteronia sinensis]